MKNVRKRLAALALSFVVACTALTPVTAKAATPTYTKEQTVYLQSKNGTTTQWLYVSNLGKSDTIKKKNVSSSNTNVASLFALEKRTSTSSYKYEYYNGAKDYEYSNKSYGYDIGVTLKKAGTTEVEFKIGNKSYTSKLTVKKYTNPVKSFKFADKTINKSKFNSQNTYGTSYKKNQDNAKLTVKAASGWKITNVSSYSPETYDEINYWCSSKPKSSVTLYCGEVEKSKLYRVSVTFRNTKDNGTITVYYYMNYKSNKSADGTTYYYSY